MAYKKLKERKYKWVLTGIWDRKKDAQVRAKEISSNYYKKIMKTKYPKLNRYGYGVYTKWKWKEEDEQNQKVVSFLFNQKVYI